MRYVESFNMRRDCGGHATDSEAHCPSSRNPAAHRRQSASHMHEAERRQITTLHLDLDDSEVDVDDLDPEELRSVVQRIRELTARILTRFGGHFAHSTQRGDSGLLWIPASPGGLRATSGLGRTGDQFGNQELAGAIEEVAGADDRLSHRHSYGHRCDRGSRSRKFPANDTRSSATFRGWRPGLAALVEPGSVVISGTTRQIVGDAFVYDSLGTHSGKAIGRNVEVFAVVGENEAATDDGRQKLPTLIGREHETGLLNQRWEQAVSGSGQVVLMCAEAGVGKSRLLSAFRQGLGDAAVAILRGSVFDLSSKQCLLSDQRVAQTPGAIEFR